MKGEVGLFTWVERGMAVLTAFERKVGLFTVVEKGTAVLTAFETEVGLFAVVERGTAVLTAFERGVELFTAIERGVWVLKGECGCLKGSVNNGWNQSPSILRAPQLASAARGVLQPHAGHQHPVSLSPLTLFTVIARVCASPACPRYHFAPL